MIAIYLGHKRFLTSLCTINLRPLSATINTISARNTQMTKFLWMEFELVCAPPLKIESPTRTHSRVGIDRQKATQVTKSSKSPGSGTYCEKMEIIFS